MASLILGPMLRHVGETSATVWVETDGPCTVGVLDAEARTFTVEGHHYALVVVEGLEPGSSTPYEVRLDGEVCWPPPGDRFPPCRVRTHHPEHSLRVVFGSCRTAAPHEPPWSLELDADPRGRGVDALYAHALRMAGRPEASWPHLAVFVGDQVYADDASPCTWQRVAARRARIDGAEDQLPADHVDGFEEYTWLYHESWSPEAERWFLSVVPTAMIFDDHDMIDDWNISASWLASIRRQPWWDEHYKAGLMTYWVYQHLGNLSPETIREEGVLAALTAVDDGTEVLRAWAERTAGRAGQPDSYRFSFARDLAGVRLVMVDTRNDRVLAADDRRMIAEDGWGWVVEQCRRPAEHLLIGSSLPVFSPGGIHDLQVWDEAVAGGAWGRWCARFGERVRRGLDLEDWPAFQRSFDDLVALLRELSSGAEGSAPRTINVLSGDIHLSYLARVWFPGGTPAGSSINQLVNSPIRNALTHHERRAMRFAMSRVGSAIGRVLRVSVRRPRTPVRWRMEHGPIFDNCLGQLVFDGPDARLIQEQARSADDGSAELVRSYEADLAAATWPSPGGQPPTPVGAARRWCRARVRRARVSVRARRRGAEARAS